MSAQTKQKKKISFYTINPTKISEGKAPNKHTHTESKSSGGYSKHGFS